MDGMAKNKTGHKVCILCKELYMPILYVHVYIHVYVYMRDEKEEKKCAHTEQPSAGLCSLSAVK